MAATNNMLRQYGAQDAVFGQTLYAHIPLAVVGIVMKVFQIVMSVSIGMAAGCIPLVGYNMGAGRKDRVKQLFIRLLATEALLGMCAMLVAELLPGSCWGSSVQQTKVCIIRHLVSGPSAYTCPCPSWPV